jgi:hypothetical protein
MANGQRPNLSERYAAVPSSWNATGQIDWVNRPILKWRKMTCQKLSCGKLQFLNIQIVVPTLLGKG